LKVALYYPWVYLTSGGERVILEVTGRGRHQWTIFTNRFEPENTFPGFKDRNVVTLGTVSVKRSVGAAGSGALKILAQKLPLQGFDALVIVCEGFGDLVLFRNYSIPAICVCLTPLRLAFDSAYRQRCLEKRGPLDGALIRTGSAIFRYLDRMAWKRYSEILCISEEVKRRAVAGGLAAKSAIDVVNPGLGFEPPSPSGRFERFFLLPGRIMWTKNIELGISSFLAWKRQHPEFSDFRLVVAGIVDKKSQPYFQTLRELAGSTSEVEFHVHPTDAELAALYQSCYATLFTAFNEDWGIVPLESMAFGKPTIAVNRGGPRESIIDGENGFLVEPTAEDFGNAMSRLVDDPELCRRMGEAGHDHVQRFSWAEFSKRVDKALDSAAQGRVKSGAFVSKVDAGA
jgi:glycosyltransferase involved in cell wall biosynthesis